MIIHLLFLFNCYLKGGMVLLSSTLRALSYGSSYLGKKKGKRKIMQGNTKFMKQESGSSSNKTETCHKRTWILHRTGEQQTLTTNSPSHGEAVQMCSLSVSVSKVAHWDMVDTKNWARPWNRRGPLAEGLIMSRRSTRKWEILIYCQVEMNLEYGTSWDAYQCFFNIYFLFF